MDALLLVSPTAQTVGYGGKGDFNLDTQGRLARREAGQVAPFVFAGCHLAAPRLFAGAPEGPFSMNLLWNRALAAGRLYGIRHDGTWLHVGTPDAIALAERALAV
jgi:MurNAc alpha-1-phosphate uridylyltransferase